MNSLYTSGYIKKISKKFLFPRWCLLNGRELSLIGLDGNYNEIKLLILSYNRLTA